MVPLVGEDINHLKLVYSYRHNDESAHITPNPQCIFKSQLGISCEVKFLRRHRPTRESVIGSVG